LIGFDHAFGVRSGIQTFVQFRARPGEVMPWKMHFKWKTVDCFVQETFAAKLTLFHSTNNTYALKQRRAAVNQFSVVRSFPPFFVSVNFRQFTKYISTIYFMLSLNKWKSKSFLGMNTQEVKIFCQESMRSDCG